MKKWFELLRRCHMLLPYKKMPLTERSAGANSVGAGEEVSSLRDIIMIHTVC
jgi:hypothetical protein